ncbi:MAG: hypothetical protein HY831_00975 [Candidatus Aenigmarchaeota archaeon]|nr:hypothetical protein [Candidatus Aenigmarchaeota archaeon]
MSEENIHTSKKNAGLFELIYKNNIVLISLIVLITLIFVNQFILMTSFATASISNVNSVSLSDADLYKAKGTIQSIALLYPVREIKIDSDAIKMMIPKGTPDYGEKMGVSFDDSKSLDKMAKAYSAIKAELQKDPEKWKRYLNLATKPVGISCEFCCGVGPIGITSNGDIACGCSHNVALQTLTMWLMKNTDYTDAQITKEAMKWKSLWFPKNMVQLAKKAADALN